MEKISLLLCTLLFFITCNKSNDFPNGTPDCVKNEAKKLTGDVMITKMTDGTSIFWRVKTEGSPQIADDEFTIFFNDKCDELCRLCFCPVVVCKVDIKTLIEVK
jgi:hypothetical protein